MKNNETSSTVLQTAVVRGFYTSFAVGLTALNLTLDHLLVHAPKTAAWYLFGLCYATILFCVANRILKGRRDFDVFLDLCFYDILIQVFGLFLRVYQLNPPEPAPLPYTVLAVAIDAMKAACLIWPLYFNNLWPVTGPCSYLKRKALGRDEKTLFVATAKYDLPDSVANTLVAALPIVCLGISYYTVATFGKDRIDLQWAVCAFVFLIYSQQAIIMVKASDEIEQDL
jgi:hypothetical protein